MSLNRVDSVNVRQNYSSLKQDLMETVPLVAIAIPALGQVLTVVGLAAAGYVVLKDTTQGIYGLIKRAAQSAGIIKENHR